MCDSYREYTIIEEHIRFSRVIHEINMRGKQILQEIERKKYYERKKRYTGITQEVYNILATITKPRVLGNNIYSSLLYFLDELLFLQVKSIDGFFIEDDQYPLSYLYFNQGEWLYSHTQDFVLDDGAVINELEAMLINSYVDEYDNFALELGRYLETTYSTMFERDKKVIRKLRRILSKLKRRLLLIKSKCLCVISQSI